MAEAIDASDEFLKDGFANGVAILESSGGTEYTQQLEEKLRQFSLNDSESPQERGRLRRDHLNDLDARVSSQLKQADENEKLLEWCRKRKDEIYKKAMEENRCLKRERAEEAEAKRKLVEELEAARKEVDLTLLEKKVEVENMKKELEAMSSDKESLLQNLDEKEAENEDLRQTVRELEKKLKEYEQKFETLTQQVKNMEEEFKKREEEMKLEIANLKEESKEVQRKVGWLMKESKRQVSCERLLSVNERSETSGFESEGWRREYLEYAADECPPEMPKGDKRD